MNRVEVQRRLGEEIPRILAETAVAPVMEDGRVVGVQVTRLPEGSLLTDAGLRTGDVLTRINDTEIDGMGTLIGLWPRLQAASELRAVVVRNGQPFSILVSLRCRIFPLFWGVLRRTPQTPRSLRIADAIMRAPWVSRPTASTPASSRTPPPGR